MSLKLDDCERINCQYISNDLKLKYDKKQFRSYKMKI